MKLFKNNQNKNNVSGLDFIRAYKPYIKQLNIADKFLADNDDDKLDSSILASVYNHLRKSMPKNISYKYDLAYYYKIGTDDFSQSRFYIGHRDNCPILNVISLDKAQQDDAWDTHYVAVLPKDDCCGDTIKNARAHFLNHAIFWSVMSVFSAGIFTMLFSTHINDTILGPILLICGCVTTFVTGCLSLIDFKNCRLHVNCGEADPYQLSEAIESISNQLQSKISHIKAHHNYHHIVAKHYKELSSANNKHNWKHISEQLYGHTHKNQKSKVAISNN